MTGDVFGSERCDCGWQLETALSQLALLLRAGGNPVPKQELLDRVWGIDQDVDPNVVEVYVRYLRQKIDAPFGLATLQTVRNVGYVLEADG